MRTFFFDKVDSTSSQARLLAAEHPGQVMLVAARSQTQGRGREGRAWVSPAGGAWFTIVWPCKNEAAAYEPTPLLVGLAVLQVVRNSILDAYLQKDMVPSQPELRIKWPNDVLLNGAKLAGVLCERELAGSEEGAQPGGTLFIGVGINADLDPAALGDDLRYPVTSMKAATGLSFDLAILIRYVTQCITEFMNELEQHGLTEARRKEIESNLAWLGKTVALQVEHRRVEAKLAGLHSDGSLILERDGEKRTFQMGEIEHLMLV